MIRVFFLHMKKLLVSALFFLIALLLVLLISLSCHAEVHAETESSDKPTRIVVFPLFAEEMLLEMVGADRIVFVGHPYVENGEAYSLAMDLARNIPGGYWTMCEETDFLPLGPDLIILSADLLDAYEHGSLFPTLAKEDIPIIFLDTPRDLIGVKNCIFTLGECVGEMETAIEMIQKIETEMQYIEETIRTLSITDDLKAVYYDPWQETFCDVARVCNAISPFGADQDFVVIDDRVVADWNPDVIFFNPVWFDTDGSILEVGGQYAESIHNALQSNVHLQSTNAILNEKIYPLNVHSSQYIIDTIWDMLRSISGDFER